MLSEQEIKEIQAETAHYEQKRAASIESLKIVQRHRGWVSDENLKDIAALLDMSPAELDNVATFYSLIYRRKVGKNVALLCDSVSCWIMGYDKLRKHFKEKYGVDLGQTTQDELVTLIPVACLGCCDKGPAMMVNDDLHVNLTPEKVDAVLAQCRKGATVQVQPKNGHSKPAPEGTSK